MSVRGFHGHVYLSTLQLLALEQSSGNCSCYRVFPTGSVPRLGSFACLSVSWPSLTLSAPSKILTGSSVTFPCQRGFQALTLLHTNGWWLVAVHANQATPAQVSHIGGCISLTQKDPVGPCKPLAKSPLIYLQVQFFLKIYFIFIGNVDIQKGETERKIFPPMIHSPSECNGRCYANSKPGASSSSPMWVQGPKALGHARLLSRAPGNELDGKWRCWD